MVHRQPTSRFVFLIFTLFLILSFTAFLTAAEDSPTEPDNDDEFQKLIAIDEQVDEEDEQQLGEQQKEAEVLSKAQRLVVELNSENAEITVKSLSISNVCVGEGSDFSGVPTKFLTINGTLRMSIYNPATIFGIHVSSSPINLVYSKIEVATGQLKKYYQPRKSRRTVSVTLEGDKVPLYGAGSRLVVSQTGVRIPSMLKFEVKWRGNVVGKLVRTKHKKQISCPVVIDSTSTKPIKFKKGICTYD